MASIRRSREGAVLAGRIGDDSRVATGRVGVRPRARFDLYASKLFRNRPAEEGKTNARHRSSKQLNWSPLASSCEPAIPGRTSDPVSRFNLYDAARETLSSTVHLGLRFQPVKIYPLSLGKLNNVPRAVLSVDFSVLAMLEMHGFHF